MYAVTPGSDARHIEKTKNPAQTGAYEARFCGMFARSSASVVTANQGRRPHLSWVSGTYPSGQRYGVPANEKFRPAML